MVDQEVSGSTAVENEAGNVTMAGKERKKWPMTALMLGIFAAVAGIAFLINALIVAKLEPVEVADEPEEVIEIEEVEEPETPAPLAALNLQPVVDAWAASVAGNKSVLIYDLDRAETIAAYNTKEDYGTASLYKLFVVYEGYRRVESGEWDGTAIATGGQTILECLDRAIRESYSPCAEALWAKIGHDELDEIIEKDYGITNSDISRLISNAEDIVAMMRRFYEHPDFNNTEMLAKMWDSFLNQPPSAGLCASLCNWRQGLPSGFSDAVKVYNKVGWERGDGRWNIYHDAAILEFPVENRHLIMVVMTNYVPYEKIAELGTKIEEAIRKY